MNESIPIKNKSKKFMHLTGTMEYNRDMNILTGDITIQPTMDTVQDMFLEINVVRDEDDMTQFSDVIKVSGDTDNPEVISPLIHPDAGHSDEFHVEINKYSS